VSNSKPLDRSREIDGPSKEDDLSAQQRRRRSAMSVSRESKQTTDLGCWLHLTKLLDVRLVDQFGFQEDNLEGGRAERVSTVLGDCRWEISSRVDHREAKYDQAVK
jgi:hypothetical protein